jgi:hypothetical protein
MARGDLRWEADSARSTARHLPVMQQQHIWAPTRETDIADGLKPPTNTAWAVHAQTNIESTLPGIKGVSAGAHAGAEHRPMQRSALPSS